MPAKKGAAKAQSETEAAATPLPWEPPIPQKTYAELSAERRAEWAEHIAAMEIPPAFQSWAQAMTEKYGPTVSVGHPEAGHQLDWLTALLVVRYGEAIHTVQHITKQNPRGEMRQFWPNAFTDDDLRRATRWWTGQDVPGGVRYLDGTKTTQRVITPNALGG